MARIKDEHKQEKGTTRSKWFWVKILFIVLGILVGTLVMLIAIVIRLSGKF